MPLGFFEPPVFLHSFQGGDLRFRACTLAHVACTCCGPVWFGLPVPCHDCSHHCFQALFRAIGARQMVPRAIADSLAGLLGVSVSCSPALPPTMLRITFTSLQQWTKSSLARGHRLVPAFEVSPLFHVGNATRQPKLWTLLHRSPSPIPDPRTQNIPFWGGMLRSGLGQRLR